MKATLYVKGIRRIEVEDRSAWGYVIGPMGVGPYGAPQTTAHYDYKVYREAEYKSVLPKDQEAVVEMVKAAAVKYGFKLKVIDVGQNRLLDRLEVRQKGISSFPTLITETGYKIEGDISEERIKTLFLTRAKNRRGVVRAF